MTTGMISLVSLSWITSKTPMLSTKTFNSLFISNIHFKDSKLLLGRNMDNLSINSLMINSSIPNSFLIRAWINKISNI